MSSRTYGRGLVENDNVAGLGVDGNRELEPPRARDDEVIDRGAADVQAADTGDMTPEQRRTHTGTHSTPLALATEIPQQMGTRRGAGVVERGGLENR